MSDAPRFRNKRSCWDCGISFEPGEMIEDDGRWFCRPCHDKLQDTQREVAKAPRPKVHQRADKAGLATRNERGSHRFPMGNSTFANMSKTGILATLFRQTKEHRGRVEDLSATGLRLMVPVKLKVGEVLTLTLNLPGMSDPIKLKGEVRWVREKTDEFCSAGVKFQGLDKQTTAKLLRYNLDQARHGGPRRSAPPGPDGVPRPRDE